MTTTPSPHDRPKRSVRRSLRFWLVAGVAGLGLGAAMTASLVSADPTDTDPTTAPVPDIPVETAGKAFVSVVAFDDRTTGEPQSTEVRFGAAHSHIGDPPLLRLTLRDENGAALKQMNAWHPLWAFVEDSAGEESRVILDQADGTFIVPFERDAVDMTIEDIPLGQQVAEVDLTGAIRDFCTDNPTDPSCRVADLAVTRVEATDTPALSLVGETGVVTVETDVTNLGPTTPMDGAVTYTASGGSGVTVTPTSAESEHELSLNEVETDARDYDVSCVEPGLHEVTFSSSITPSHPADVDLVAGNNEQSTTVTVDCVVPITINIKPGGTPNPINVKVRNGSIPVALLTTEAGEYGNPIAFDATTVLADTALFGERDTILGGDGAVARHGRGHIERSLELDERTRDADLDMVIQFTAPVDTGLAAGDTEACTLGTFMSGGTEYRFWGCDEVRVLHG